MQKAILACLAVCGCALPASVIAGPANDGQFSASVYGWLPSVSGQTTFPSGTGGADISVSARTLLNNLHMTFMGAFGFQQGRWGLVTDVLYVDVGNTKTTTRGVSIGDAPLPADVTARTRFDVKNWVWTLAGSYRIVDSDEGTFDVVAGLRLLDARQSLDWQLGGNVGPIPVVDQQGSVAAAARKWDAIAGFKGRWRLGQGERWFLPYYVDAGTGQSRLTWQVVGGLGYALDRGEVSVVWRHLEYDMKSSDAIDGMQLDGPALAFTIRW